MIRHSPEEPVRPAVTPDLRRRLAKLLLAIVLTLALGLGASVAYFAYDLPLAANLETPDARAFSLEAADGEVFAYRGVHQGETQSFDTLPGDFVNAVLAIEDRRFFSHAGIDWRGIARAIWTNARAGDIREGGSTLTQQYVKLAYLTRDRSLRRKVQEAILAFWLESRLDKREIFRRYVNIAYFGAGAYGVDAAARRYFGKAAGGLTLAESAMLAGLLRAPSQLAPTRNFDAATARAKTVLDSMVQAGFLSPERAAQAATHPARLKFMENSASSNAYFADWVQSQAVDNLGAIYGDFGLRTTLQPELQAFAQSAIEDALARDGEALAVEQAALVAMTLDGAVVAMVGGRDYGSSQFNRATQARRQPGSLFKLFVFQAALEAGFSPDSRLTDEPVTVEGWSPRNYSKRYLGTITLREAFANSVNTVAVKLSEKIGRDKVVATARRMGITTPIPSHPSLALGTSGTSLLEITAAYGAVRAGTTRLTPFGIQEIAAGGRPLIRPHPTGSENLKGAAGRARAAMRELLVSSVRDGTGRAARMKEPAGGKTGTSQDHRDAWFVGFSDELVVGVWVGNDDNRPMKAVTGGGLPAKIWRAFMDRSRAARKRLPVNAELESLPEPASRARDGVSSNEHRAAKTKETPKPTSKRKTAKSKSTHKSESEIARSRTPETFKGRPKIIDTATLRFGRDDVRLIGVTSGGNGFVRNMESYIGARSVICRPYDARFHRCEVGGFDLSEVVIFNGGARATRSAPAYLRKAEARAREGRRGIWAR